MVAHVDDRVDVPVLEGNSSVGVDLDPVPGHDPHDARSNRVDRRSIGSGDVYPLVVGEGTATGHQVSQSRVPSEHGSRVAEAAANRMLLVERLHRPAVGRGCLRAMLPRGRRGGILHRERRPAGKGTGGDRRGEDERCRDAAPCAAAVMSVRLHDPSVLRGANRPLTPSKRGANGRWSAAACRCYKGGVLEFRLLGPLEVLG